MCINSPPMGIMNIVQTVLDRDVHCISMRAYRNRQNFHVKPPGWNLLGKIWVKEIMEVVKLVVEGEEGNERKIFREHHTQHGKIKSLGIR